MIFDKSVKERNGIWWLASYPKSGNTWVRMFINSALSGFPPNINAVFQYVTGDHLDTYYQLTSAIKISDMDALELVWYRPAVLLNYLASRYPCDACLKTHHANLGINNIFLCPAQISKGAVYLIRDPRDIAVSFSKHVGLSIDETIDLMGNEKATISTNKENKDKGSWTHDYLMSWSTHVKSWTSEENVGS